MVEEIPDSYPKTCATRAAFANFDMSVFTEDSNKSKFDVNIKLNL